MDSILPEENGSSSPGSGSRSLAGAMDAPLVARRLRSAHDLDQLERMLLAFATHPEGVGFDRVELMLFDGARSGFAAWRRARKALVEFPLATALERARLSTSDRTIETEDPAMSPILPLAGLDEAARSALERGESAVAVGLGGETPWRPGTQRGAAVLRREGAIFAMLVGEWDGTLDSVPRRAALDGWAMMAEGAIATCERRSESRRFAERSAAAAELARKAVASGNIAEVLHVLARVAVEAGGARGSAVWRIPSDGDAGENGCAPRLEVTYGPASQRERIARALQPLAAAAVASLHPRNVECAAEEPLLSPEAAAGIKACSVMPLVAYGRAVGALAVYGRVQMHPLDPTAFDPAQLEFFGALADTAALALDHASSFDAIACADHQRRELSARVRRLERLASAGEAATRISREARNPIASIRGFVRRALQGVNDDDPRREYLEIVAREADRLEGLFGEEMESRPAEPATLALERMNDVVQDVLQRAGETLVRRRIRLVKKLAPDLPPLIVDPERIRHVTTRILRGALDAVALGGRIRVETRRAGQYAVVEVAHDGTRGVGDAMEQLLVPFGNGVGGGLGLGIAQRIVHEHGGEIRVRAEGEWSTIIAFTLPIAENQDRRRAGPDRRHGRSDRRRRFPTT